jgi:predicted permease
MRDPRPQLREELAGLRIAPERWPDLIEELAQDLEERARAARASGSSEEDAATIAWAALGSTVELRTRLQEVESWSPARQAERDAPLGAPPRRPLAGWDQDLRHAFRSLRRSPGFTAVALLTLGLGIGANTTIFSVINALFLTPLPVSDPERVVSVFTSDYSGPLHGRSSYPDFEDLRNQPELFESLAAYSFDAVALKTDRDPIRVWAELVSGEYFPTLGLPMALGRALGPKDDEERAQPAIVISHGLWQRRLAGDSSALGRTLTLSGTSFTVVGVAPQGFLGMTRGLAVEAWVPLSVRSQMVAGSEMAAANRGARFLALVGRLPAGAAIADTQARLDVVAEHFHDTYPDPWTDHEGKTRQLTVLAEAEARIAPNVRTRLLSFSALLALVVGLILLIACANVANLMLARASTRRREIAVRLALGASRARLVRHFLTESVVVVALGGVLGVALTFWASGALSAFAPPLPVPIQLQVLVDTRVLVFAVSLTVVTGLLLGLAPGLQATKPDLVPALKDDGGGVAAGWLGRRLRRVFVAAQVALCMVLLVGAGLLLRGLSRSTQLSPGFDLETPRLIPVDTGLAGYDVAQTSDLIQQLEERSARLPGLRAAALTMTLPVELHVARRTTLIEGHVPRPGEDEELFFGVVGPGHFQALEIPILQGREFDAQDREDSQGVVIVNETFAERFWPEQDPIGKTIRLRSEDSPQLRVVGLARDSTYRTLGEEAMPFYYLPITQDFGFVRRFSQLFPLHVVVRSDTPSSTRAVMGLLDEIDPGLPVYPPKRMIDHLGLSALPSRLASAVFTAFGSLGLLLASLGVYGVVSQSVTQRAPEIGVRIALGASRREVLSLVLREGLKLGVAGLIVGALLSAALATALASLLYGLDPFDPVTFILVPLLLVAVIMAASALPAHKAARVDPVVALRYE